jgi:hypothetical protein
MTSHWGSPPPEDPPRNVAAHAAGHLPAPSIWPVTLALGGTLAAAGLITDPFVLVAGAVFTVAGLVGWIAQLTEEAH